MGVETIGEAYSLGWRVTIRCVYSRARTAPTRNQAASAPTGASSTWRPWSARAAGDFLFRFWVPACVVPGADRQTSPLCFNLQLTPLRFASGN
jgi:hypothetical protein